MENILHKTRIAFFGTKGWFFTNKYLEKFISSGANIVVFVQDTTGSFKSTLQDEGSGEIIEQAAKRLNVPVLTPEDIKDKKFQKQFTLYKPDVIVVCGYQYYIPKEVINAVPIGIINFHSSLLPRHCGMHPGFWTIWYGDRTSGMTVHFMDDGIDTGDIIYFSKVPVKTGDTIETLYERIWNSGMTLADKLLDDLDKGSLLRKKQDYSKYTYNYDICERDFELDFRQPAEILKRRIMMLPGKFYFNLGCIKFYVYDCDVLNKPLKTRKFKINIPYLINEQIIFVTPRQFLAIKKVKKDRMDFNPLDLLKI